MFIVCGLKLIYTASVSDGQVYLRMMLKKIRKGYADKIFKSYRGEAAVTGNQQDTLYRGLRGRVFGQAFKTGAGLYCESAENRKRGMGGSLKLPEGTCLPADAPD